MTRSYLKESSSTGTAGPNRIRRETNAHHSAIAYLFVATPTRRRFPKALSLPPGSLVPHESARYNRSRTLLGHGVCSAYANGRHRDANCQVQWSCIYGGEGPASPRKPGPLENYTRAVLRATVGAISDFASTAPTTREPYSAFRRVREEGGEPRLGRVITACHLSLGRGKG